MAMFANSVALVSETAPLARAVLVIKGVAKREAEQLWKGGIPYDRYS
jgi:hypothetical protein